MYRLLCLLICVLFATDVFGQQVVISEGQKLSGKTPNLRILGKNDQGLIIYKFGKGTDIVEAFNDDLIPKWSQNLSIKQENSGITDIIIYPTFSVAYFLAQEKDFSVLYAQILGSRFKTGGKFIVADTINGARGEIEERMKTVYSQNRKHLLTYYPHIEGGKLAYIQLTGLSDELDELYKTKLIFPEHSPSQVMVKALAANNGRSYFLFEDVDRNRRKFDGTDFVLYEYDPTTGDLIALPLQLEAPVHGGVNMTIDNVNNYLAVAGFFTDEDGDEAKGYFLRGIDMTDRMLGKKIDNNFTRDMLFQIAGKDSSRDLSGLFSFKVNSIILRQDGGALLLTESQYNDQEIDNGPTSFGPSAGPNFRSVNVYYYNDVFIINLKPDGSMDWFNLLRKKQISEDDDGFFSSYGLLTMDNSLKFIYNEEIYYKTNVNEYTLTPDGTVERSFMFNAGMKDIMLAPGLAKQISGNEIIIPSFRNRSVKFVKVTF